MLHKTPNKYSFNTSAALGMLPSIDTGRYQPEENVHKITDYQCVSRDHQHTSIKQRLYLHLDINCFYAQVEQQSFNLWGMPVYVGGWYKGDQGTPRGIVATSSYEARIYGIKTGMSAFEAEQLCPWAIGLQAHYEKYKGISQLLEDLLHEFTITVEKYSMDEFFLDINHLKNKSKDWLLSYCQQLRYLIHKEIGLVVSIGVANSKTYAKLASDLHKPNGITIVISPEAEETNIYPLPLDKVWGIGKKRYQKLKDHGITTIGEGIERGYQLFQDLFGEYFGKIVWEMVAGKDRAKVLTEQQIIPKQLNYMHTFSDWTDDPERMRGYQLRARRFFAYLRLQDRAQNGISFRFNTDGYTNLDDYVYYECMSEAWPRILNLLKAGYTFRGVGVGTLKTDGTLQQELFFEEDLNQRQFYKVQDAINNKFGMDTITKATVMDNVPGKTHFLERS